MCLMANRGPDRCKIMNKFDPLTLSASKAFTHRITSSKSLSGLETRVTWLGDRTATISVRHVYGPWVSLTIFAIGESMCESENGSAVRHADVAYRLKQLVLDNAFRGARRGKRRMTSHGNK